MMIKKCALSLFLVTTLFTSVSISAKDKFEEGFKAASSGNYAHAVEIWQPLAEQDNALAQSNLGVLYENGWGVKQSAEMAFFWYQKAAEKGQIEAQHNLAGLYQQGNGVKKDLNSAGYWFEKAASAGHGDSQVILGVMYQEIEDYPQAIHWYKKAINQKVEGAQKNLDYLCQLPSIKAKKLCK